MGVTSWDKAVDQVKAIQPFTPEEVDQLELLLGHIESPLLDRLLDMAAAWPAVIAVVELHSVAQRVVHNHWEGVFEYEDMILDLKERVRLLLPPDEKPRYRYDWGYPEEAFTYLGRAGIYDLFMAQSERRGVSFLARFGDEEYEELDWGAPHDEAKRRAIERGLYKE